MYFCLDLSGDIAGKGDLQLLHGLLHGGVDHVPYVGHQIITVWSQRYIM